MHIQQHQEQKGSTLFSLDREIEFRQDVHNNVSLNKFSPNEIA